MEAREIFVANTKTQQKVKVTTDATTLGELKAALDAAGVDYQGMEFTEGLSKTVLLDNASPLPKDIMYKGQVTNNLVILLTNTKKNIASGSDGSRAEAYIRLKEFNLQDLIKEHFGRNYTQVPTDQLWSFIEEALEDEDEKDDVEMEEEEENNDNFSCAACSFYDLVKMLVKAEQISVHDIRILIDLLTELANRMDEEKGVRVGNVALTNEELEEMMNL